MGLVRLGLVVQQEAFTPENQALMATGGALLAECQNLANLIGKETSVGR